MSERRLSQEMSQNASLAATLAQFMLPGTVNLFYGDEIALHHLAPMLNRFFTTNSSLPWSHWKSPRRIYRPALNSRSASGWQGVQYAGTE